MPTRWTSPPARPVGMGCVISRMIKSDVRDQHSDILADCFKPAQVSVGAPDGGGILLSAINVAWEIDQDHHIEAWDLKNFHNSIARAACLSALAELPAGARTCVQVNWAEVRAEMDLCASGEKLPFTSRSGGGQGDPDLDLAAAAALNGLGAQTRLTRDKPRASRASS